MALIDYLIMTISLNLIRNNIEGIYYQAEKIVKLRKECQQNQLNNNLKNLGIIGIFTLTLFGGLSLIDVLTNKKRKRTTTKKSFKSKVH